MRLKKIVSIWSLCNFWCYVAPLLPFYIDILLDSYISASDPVDNIFHILAVLFRIPCKQQMEQLADKVKRLSNERESLKEQLSSLQSALRDHQQVCNRF